MPEKRWFSGRPSNLQAGAELDLRDWRGEHIRCRVATESKTAGRAHPAGWAGFERLACRCLLAGFRGDVFSFRSKQNPNAIL